MDESVIAAGEAKPPGISVVVPNYNSSRYLARLLTSIDEAARPSLPLEVLVVDDSEPGEVQATESLCLAHGARFLHCAGRVGVKRNFGGRAARYNLLLFVDSDCELTPDLLREHAKLLDQPADVGAMLGPVEFPGADSFMWRAVERSQFLGPYSFAHRMPYAPWGGAGNLSVKGAAYEAIGGFDSGFLQVPGGEDVDLGMRLNDAGFRIRCNPDALMYHTRETWQDARKMTRRAVGYGRAHAHILMKHAHRTGLEFPRPVVVVAGLALLSLVVAAATGAWRPLVWSPLFAAVFFVVQALLLIRNRPAPPTPRSLAHELAGQWFNQLYELGVVFESVKQRRMSQTLRKMIYAPGQLVHEREGKIIQTWSELAGLLVVLFYSGVAP